MKRKLLAIILLVALLSTNYGFVFAYTRGTDGANISTRSTPIPQTVTSPLAWVEQKYKAHSQKVTRDKIKVYNYNTTTEKTLENPERPTQMAPFNKYPNSYYLGDIRDAFKNIGNVINSTDDQDNQRSEDYQAYNMQMAFPIGQTFQGIATIVYKDYIVCNNKTYDLKVDISEIRSTKGSADTEAEYIRFIIPLGIRHIPSGYTYLNAEVNENTVIPSSENDPTAYDYSTYNLPTQFNIVMNTGTTDKGGHAEADIKYTIIDGNNNAPVSSMFVFTDIDKNQGMVVKDFVADKNNTFIPGETDEYSQQFPLNVKTVNNKDTYFYATNPEAAAKQSDIYVLKDKTSTINTTATWDDRDAGFQFVLRDDLLGNVVNVTFDENHGDYCPETQKLVPGNKATKPDRVPQREGYDFVGWKIKGTDTIFNFNTPVNEDIELIADWKQKPTPYNINYELYGGTNAIKNINKQSYYAGETFVFDIPTKEGYNFGGWFLRTEDFNDPSKKFDEITASTTGDLTLHAKWTKIVTPYTINYDLDGGTNTQRNIMKETYYEGETFEFDSPTKEGYDFGGWFLSKSDFSNESKKFTKIIPTTTGDLTLYAKWIKQTEPEPEPEPEPYKISYDLDGGTNTQKNINKISYYEGESFTFDSPTRDGYDFEGWFLSKSDFNDESKKFIKITPTTTGDLTLYAKWKKIDTSTQYNINYELYGGTNTKKNNNKTIYYEGETFEFDDPTREGYDFGGWFLSTSDFDDESKIFTEITPTTTGNLTLHAKWIKQEEPEPEPEPDPTPVLYNINYVLNGGTNTQRNNNKTSYYVGDTFEFDDPSKNGYSFGGWFLNPDDYNDESKRFTKITNTTTGDLTLYAKWIQESTPSERTANYTIEYYLEGKDGNYNRQASDSKSGIIGNVVTAETKTFNHYHENSTHPGTKKTDVLKESGTVLKIYYDRDDCKVTFIPQNGNGSTTTTVKYLDPVDEPTKPTRSEYEFKYWYYKDSNGNEKRYSFGDPVENDIDLYAKWEKIEKDPDPIPSDDGKKDDGKKDDTTAPTPIPKTGQIGLAILIVIFGVTFAIGFFKSRKIK